MLSKIINREDLFPKVLVSVRAPTNFLGVEEIKDSISVVDWHMPASTAPMRYAISLRNDDSTKNMISKAGNFVVNFMGNEHKSLVLSCEGKDGVFSDLFDLAGITKKDSERVESPIIKEAKAFLECEVEQELESGDHTVFIGKVVGAKG